MGNLLDRRTAEYPQLRDLRATGIVGGETLERVVQREELDPLVSAVAQTLSKVTRCIPAPRLPATWRRA